MHSTFKDIWALAHFHFVAIWAEQLPRVLLPKSCISPRCQPRILSGRDAIDLECLHVQQMFYLLVSSSVAGGVLIMRMQARGNLLLAHCSQFESCLYLTRPILKPISGLRGFAFLKGVCRRSQQTTTALPFVASSTSASTSILRHTI